MTSDAPARDEITRVIDQESMTKFAGMLSYRYPNFPRNPRNHHTDPEIDRSTQAAVPRSSSPCQFDDTSGPHEPTTTARPPCAAFAGFGISTAHATVSGPL